MATTHNFIHAIKEWSSEQQRLNPWKSANNFASRFKLSVLSKAMSVSKDTLC